MRRRVEKKTNKIRREFTLYTNQSVLSQVDEIKELIISIEKLSKYNVNNYYYECPTKINNNETYIANYTLWDTYIYWGYLEIQVNINTQYISIFRGEFDIGGFSNINDIVNDIVFEYSEFKNTDIFGDTINIELL